MTTKLALAAVLMFAVGCSLYSEADDAVVDAGAVVETVSRDRAESCRTACSASTDREYLGQLCPGKSYPECEAECADGEAVEHWCPLATVR